MITIYIDKTSYDRGGLAEYLREVANDVEEGASEGIDWELKGKEEEDPSDFDPPEPEDDYSPEDER